MTQSIIAAIITGLLSLAGVYFSNRKSAALMEYRMEQLEKKVDLHNSVIERTYKLEESVARLQDEDRRHNERIKILEGNKSKT